MKTIPKAIIVNTPVFEHGDVVEFRKELPNGVIGEVGIVSGSNDKDFTCYLVASKKFVRVSHDDESVRYVGRVTKTSFKPCS